jgi:GT2 family glycosyltransferase
MLTVLIVHWNRPVECLATIGHFLRQGKPLSIRIVDNSSRPECVQALKQGLPAGVELTQLSENKGWGGALNVMLRKWLAEEGSDYCAISAHDTILQPDCLALLIDAMDRDKRLGLACPQYETPEITRYSPIRGGTFERVAQRPTGEVTPLEFPFGTLMIVRKDCLKEMGLYDERHFAYGDEIEIGLRARKMGWNIGVVWGATIINPGTWTASPVVGYLTTRNSLLMAKDYGGTFSAGVRLMLMLANTLRLLASRSAAKSMSSPGPRFLGMRDFLRGRYGPPPPALVSNPGRGSSDPAATKALGNSAR